MALYSASRSFSFWWRPLRPVAATRLFSSQTPSRGRRSDITLLSTAEKCLTRSTHSNHAITSRSYGVDATSTTPPGIYLEIRPSPDNENDEIATIQVSNGTKMNIVNSELLQQLIETCNTLATRNRLRAVILTGGPTPPGKSPSFIGGADIKEMSSLSSASEARAFITQIHQACQALRSIPVPVIAKINGFCLGAGLEIMASCDLRVATNSSKFGMPETKVGIPSVVEAALLPGLIGMGRTRRFLYLAETISATEAEKWGLVEKVVEEEEKQDEKKSLDIAVDEWINALVSAGPKAIQSQKRLMRAWESCSVDEGIQLGIEAFAEA